MKKRNELFDKLFQIFPGWSYGFFAGVIGLMCDFLAVLLYPNYDFQTQMVSELALGPGGLFFNMGLIIPSILGIPFVVFLYRALKDDSVNNYARKAVLIVSEISLVSCALIGMFPAIPNDSTMILLHGNFTGISWVGGLTSFSLFGFLMMKHPKFSKSLVFYGFITAFIFGLHVLLMIFTASIIPVIEWTVHLSIKPWSIINALFLARKKN